MSRITSSSSTSNSIVKVFIKKGRRIVFHLKTHLFIPTPELFDSKMIRLLTGYFTLDGKRMKFETASFVTYGSPYDHVFDGKTKVIETYFSTVMDYRFLKHQMTDLEITIEYLIKGKPKNLTFRTIGLIRKMYDERVLKETGKMP